MRARQQTRRLLTDQLGRLARRLQTHHLLYLCALVPLLIIPPLVSLASSIALMGRTNHRARNSLEWIATVSMLNILLSCLVLYRFHFSPADLLAYLADGFLRALRSLLPVVPVDPGRAGPTTA